VVGVVSGDGHLILHDEKDDTVPLDLDLVPLPFFLCVVCVVCVVCAVCTVVE
jgi:hypothetical protein